MAALCHRRFIAHNWPRPPDLPSPILPLDPPLSTADITFVGSPRGQAADQRTSYVGEKENAPGRGSYAGERPPQRGAAIAEERCSSRRRTTSRSRLTN
ncbi:hypothetical protein Drorol1_Dr00019646 [Drosera rotundifolia]